MKKNLEELFQFIRSIQRGKKNKVIYIFLFLLFIAYFPNTVRATTKTAVIGSSSFVGGCSSGGFVEKLKKALPDKAFECFAKSGSSSSFFLDQYNTKVKGKGFSEIILYGGLNGLNNTTGLQNTQKNLTTIIQSAKSEGSKIIIMGAQPFKGYNSWTQTWGDNIKANNAWLAGKPYGIDSYIDVYSNVDKDNDDTIDSQFDSGDHLHLNKTGQEVMFALLMQQAYGGYTPGPDSAGFDASTLGQQSPASTVTPIPTGYFPCSDQDPKTGSMIDAVFDTQEYTSETKPQIKCPQPQIIVPGLQFGGVYIPEEGDVDGGFYAYLPFIGDYILALYRYAIAAAGIISIIMIIFGGFQWMISGSSSDSISSAKKKIAGAIIGLFFAILSYTILYTLNPNLVQFRNLKIQYIQGKSLDNMDFYAEEKGEFDASAYTGGGKPFGTTEFDQLFQKFAACIGINWQLLKAMAHHESALNPNAENPKSSATGLFQAMWGFPKIGKKTGGWQCRPVLAKVDLAQHCSTRDGLKNPEVNSAYGILVTQASFQKINKKCPNSSLDDKVFMLYFGHSSGPGALGAAINRFSCNTNQWPDGLWPEGSTYAGKKIFNGASKGYVQKIVVKIRSLGVTEFAGPKNITQCPIGSKL